MRGMIKWKPFNTLLTSDDLLEIQNKRLLIDKPVLAEDNIISIDNVIKTSLNESLEIKVKYFNHGKLFVLVGVVKKINVYEKYILIDSVRIYFKNLISASFM